MNENHLSAGESAREPAPGQPLSGGNTSVVTRVGDKVHRTAGRWTPAVHDLLRHLERAGFDGAPRPLGIEGDREVLGYVPGEVGTLAPEEPLAPWFRTAEACAAIGRWLRRCHDAQATFEPDVTRPWRRAAGRALAPGEVVVHHDVSPYNTVRRDDGSLVVVDWDFARPGDPLEDIAWACWRWAPLMAGTWWHTEYGVGPDEDVAARQEQNLRALVEAYSPAAEQRARLADAIGHQMASHADDLDDMARTDPAFAALVERDYARAARADADWWHSSPLRAVVTP